MGMSYYYFSSKVEGALKINGNFQTILNSQPTPVENFCLDSFIEFYPLNGQNAPIQTIITKDTTDSPPKNLFIVDMKGGYLIQFCPIFSPVEYRLICQQKYSQCVCNLFYDNGVKLTVQTQNDFYAYKILEDVNSGEFYSLDNSNFYIALITYGQMQTVSVYCVQGKIQKIFEHSANEIKIDNNIIYTTEYKNDIAKHQIDFSYSLVNGQIQLTNKIIKQSENFSPSRLPEKLISYAFLEEVCVGGNLDFYLSTEMTGKKEMLKSYLGEFVGVIIPPPFRDYKEVGLLYKETTNKYLIRYVLVDTSDGKVVNLRILDD